MTETTDHDLLIKVNTQIEQIMKTLNELAPTIKSLNERLSEIEEASGRHSERLTALRGDVDALKMDKLNRNEINSIRKDVEDLQKKSNAWDMLNSIGVATIAVLDYLLRR